MSAERLREAAALMRERAQAEPVPSGPWETEFSDVIRTDVPLGNDGYMVAEAATLEEAKHIASWHPDVALAVADWLDYWAGQWMNGTGPSDRAALAVADTYLGSRS